MVEMSLRSFKVHIISMPDVSVISMPTVSVEEQYQLAERKALAVTTTENDYPITSDEPKVVTLIADGCDMQVDKVSITADSPKLIDRASLSMTLNGEATTIYAKAVSGSGTLYIMVFT